MKNLEAQVFAIQILSAWDPNFKDDFEGMSCEFPAELQLVIDEWSDATD